jgi:hypothetical protein
VKKHCAKLFLALLWLPLAAPAWTVSVGSWVCNPEAGVSVPVEIDDAAGLAYAAVRVNYDPQVLVCLRIERGGLDGAFDGDFLAADDEAGSLTFARFRAADGVAPSGGGVLARIVFAVRPGTARQYSDVAIADIRLGDDTGVRDLALAGTIAPAGGMVRIFPENGVVARLEDAQTIAGGTHLTALTLSEGDAIQASADGTPIVVSGETTATAWIPVLPPEGGWADGTYALLKTATRGLSFVSAEDDGAPLDVTASEADGLYLYSLHIDTGNSLEVISSLEDETLGPAATAYVQGLFDRIEGVSRVIVSGGEKNILLARAFGIHPAETRTGGTIEAAFEPPAIDILDYDLESGVIHVRVTPGTGNTIATDLVKGVVRLCGGESPDDLCTQLEIPFTVDAANYLQPGSEGKFTLSNAVLDFGPTTFFRIGIVTTP